ncbi:nickel pincer cofactor biosynthesis protein LarC [Actinocatenispora comari]|uniref:Pyridinium-3,5-bisthiocarboxylic acid mononucleotide nickel insertion protein n=1 Tax=Actinocatenispora comari TaxID=2807577 RepID=A0A8J4ALH5_9ACTN|nr:nickel pincer cofactor biosynthesis protein LarC [Actinocatenispora comari]GIL31992.1 TIGR00299 family protein [Actinocatenispora comari]
MIGWLDCANGASGDMFLGTLVDAGVPLEHLQAMVSALPVEPIRLTAESTSRHAIAATKVHVEAPESHHHRHWSDVREIVTGAALPAAVRDTALDAFGRLAAAEAEVHGTSPEEVHFHEVGALDAIADIVGTCAGIAWLREHRGLTDLSAGPLALGSGRARGAHGAIPIPGPAVLGIVAAASIPVTGGDLPYEACTPTGAALLATHVARWRSMPPLRVTGTGVGAGGRDPAETANVLRLVLGEPADLRPAGRPEAGPGTDRAGTAAGAAGPDAADRPHAAAAEGLAAADQPRAAAPDEAEALVLECNVDDLDPRLWPAVLARLLAAGAADAWLTPILMKKGRPAHTLSVLCRAEHAAAVRGIVFAETSSIGLRAHPVRKFPLDRAERAVTVGGRSIRVKVASDDGSVVNVSVEYADVAAAAAALSLPAKQVLARATAAAAELYPAGAAQ